MKWSRLLSLLASFLVTALFVLAWKLVADYKLVSPVFLPGPDRAWTSLVRGFTTGDLGVKFLATVERMFWGWLIASLIGVALGAAIGTSPKLRAYLAPMLEFLRPLPASATIPVAIAVLGLSDGMVLAVIAFGALWPVLLATIHGFAAVEPRLYEVGRALRLSRATVIAKIALPSASPDILAGMRLGLTVALILSVVCEMIAGRDGLGNWILLAARSFRAPDLYAGVILLGLLGYFTAIAIGLLEARLLVWRSRAR
ncbi:ABC transporter permease [Tianweitania sediminis]|uniref:ABC transporter permease n=1 Tax=Tianweitania sediminis TaxID=1502156 RepID=A0A8J7UKD9_9HYPH|nr:ABC transporter permease [Tianweitania sediminis]MBP0438262.1 ABC transporter permease [Tianweitania sediminis]